MASPENIKTIESDVEIQSQLENRFEVKKLEKGVPVKITKPDYDYNDSMFLAKSETTGSHSVFQYVRAVIQAGADDMFCLLDTDMSNSSRGSYRDPDSKKHVIAVTRIKEGQPAELVGYLNDAQSTLYVGRNHQENMGLSRKTSYDHFSLTYTEDGDVMVTDMLSTNGTKLIVNNREKQHDADSTDKPNSLMSNKPLWKQDESAVWQDFFPASIPY